MTQTAISHHLDQATLLAYATGTLPEAFSLVVAAHVSLCDDCRAELGALDAVGGALLDDAAPADLDSASLDATLARIAGAPPAAPRKRVPGVLPGPVQDYVGGDLDQIRWRPVGMGVKQAILPTAPGATARLLYIPAGVAMPDHGHHGTELTLVLQGAFHDGDARFARGDVETADADIQHIPVADIHEDCICLAATDAPLRFAGWLPRIVQRFVRI